jgi:hypothetical protein
MRGAENARSFSVLDRKRDGAISPEEFSEARSKRIAG